MRPVCSVLMLFGIVVFPSPGLAQDKFLDTNGIRIRYVEKGAGEPVVLLHGLGGSVQSLVDSGVFDKLAADHRVIAFDARGHGKSSKPHEVTKYGGEMALDVIRLLDHLSIRRAHIVGYSMGAAITSQLLTRHPERFLTATLGGGAGTFQWTADDERSTQQIAAEFEKECVSRTMLQRAANPGQRLTEDEIERRSTACFSDPTWDRFAVAALLRSRRDMDLVQPTQAAAVTVPTLGIAGSLDSSLAGLQALRQLRPALKLVIIDGATHSGERGAMRRPEYVAAVREFISSNRALGAR